MSAKSDLNTSVRPPDHSAPMEDPLRILADSLAKLYGIWVNLTYPFASKGHKLIIHWTCDLPRRQAHRIKVGNSIEIRKDAIIEVVAPPEQNGKPIIVIDDRCLIAHRCLVSAKNCIHIERDVIMGQAVLITDHGYADEGDMEGGRIRIGEGCWIGHGAAIICTQGELVLGRNCVVGANSVVTESTPPNSVIFGNPASVIRQFDLVKNKWVNGRVQSVGTDNTR